MLNNQQVLKFEEIFSEKQKAIRHLGLLIPEFRLLLRQDKANVYSDEAQKLLERKHLNLEFLKGLSRPFFRKTGLLPLLERILELNSQLLNYHDENGNKVDFNALFSHDVELNQRYLNMIQLANFETRLINSTFKPMLEQISQRQDIKEAWFENVGHFKNFLKLMAADIVHFSKLVNYLESQGHLEKSREHAKEKRAETREKLISYLQNGNFDQARNMLAYAHSHGWFTNEEVLFLNKLVDAIRQNSEEIDNLFNRQMFWDIFKSYEERIELLRFFAMKYYLLLTPINSSREKSKTKEPIKILNLYSSTDKNAIEIGKLGEWDIQLADSKIDEPLNDEKEPRPYAYIKFELTKLKFVIYIRSPDSTIRYWNNNTWIQNQLNFMPLVNGLVFEINGYVFSVQAGYSRDPVADHKEYNRQFLDLVLKLDEDSSSPDDSKTAGELENVINILGTLRESAPDLGLDAGTKNEIRDALQEAVQAAEDLEQANPQLANNPEIKVLRRTRMQKLMRRGKAYYRLKRGKRKTRTQIKSEAKEVIGNSKGLIVKSLINSLSKFRNSLTRIQNFAIESQIPVDQHLIIETDNELARTEPLVKDFQNERISPKAKFNLRIFQNVINIIKKIKSNIQLLCTKVANALHLDLIKTRNEIEQASSIVSDKVRTLRLVPINLKGKKVWQVGVDGDCRLLQMEMSNLRRTFENARKHLPSINLGNFGILSDAKLDDIKRSFRMLAQGRASLQRRVRRITSYMGTRSFALSMLLIPMLIGASPKNLVPALWPTNQEIIEEALGKKLSDEQFNNLVKASDVVDNLVKMLENTPRDNLPDYLKEMISDGVLDIALFAGAEIYGHIPISQGYARIVVSQKVILHIRYIDTIEKAKKAFEESDVIHVQSHSRYGLGWSLAGEGMANPLKMQTHPIKIPKSALHGYGGKILKDLGDGNVIVETSDEDIENIKPKAGYQLISMNSCSSGQHFLETIKRLREGLPTTVIYTTQTTQTTGYDIFNIMMKGLFTGQNIEEITKMLDENQKNLWQKNENYYQAVVLNTDEGSEESRRIDENNIPNAITLYRDF